MSNPHAKHNTAIKNILDKFYDAFVREDYQTISGLIDNKNPQMVINVRHWYGEVQKYEILSIQSDGKFEKKAKVRVTSRFNNEERNNIDRISLIKQQDEWFIQSYNSDLDYTLP
ncbi:hypothetical protein J2TS4_56540 [Paenibacillus sp. J2TS4]|nr:hypothetical protein J2TS4_56540 [Paenibacillus sp. J2TS4]